MQLITSGVQRYKAKKRKRFVCFLGMEGKEGGVCFSRGKTIILFFSSENLT